MLVGLTAGFKGRGKLCPKTCETAALRRGIQKVSSSQPGLHMTNDRGHMKAVVIVVPSIVGVIFKIKLKNIREATYGS